MTFHPGQIFFTAGAAPFLDARGALPAFPPTLFESGGVAPAGDELRNGKGGKPPGNTNREYEQAECKARGQDNQAECKTNRHAIDEGSHKKIVGAADA